MKFELHHGDCLDVLKTLADCSVDAIVTDPPAGIAFMGKEWDRDKGGKADWIQWMQSVADQCLRVIKPGGHALVWAIPRTSHWTGAAWEDAGWQPRDKIYHVFGSGFPKSLDVSKAIDKAARAEREVVGSKLGLPGYHLNAHRGGEAFGEGLSSSTFETRLASSQVTAPATEAAKQWEGWGTALKPAAEEWWLFRKPPIGTIAANVLEHGTGGLNIGACRVGDEVRVASYTSLAPCHGNKLGQAGTAEARRGTQCDPVEYTGRWPANLIHDNSEEVLALFPEVGGGKFAERTTPANRADTYSGFDGCSGKVNAPNAYGDSGSAARFFYCAKASRDDRDEGLPMDQHSSHPTVKPTDLMRYLCRLITPPGGIVLDPFTGSGSTGKAAMAEGFRFIGIEREAEYIEIARARISAEAQKPRQLSLF
jgi:site-specific DNA-methyltransferase (adenine-specific)